VVMIGVQLEKRLACKIGFLPATVGRVDNH